MEQIPDIREAFRAFRFVATLVIESLSADGWSEVLRTSMQYYAITLDRLQQLLSLEGFDRTSVEGNVFFNPCSLGLHRTAV